MYNSIQVIIGGDKPLISGMPAVPTEDMMCFVNAPRYDGNHVVGGRVVQVHGEDVYIHLYYGSITTKWQPARIPAPELGRGRTKDRVEIFNVSDVYHHSFSLTDSRFLSSYDRQVGVAHMQSYNQ